VCVGVGRVSVTVWQGVSLCVGVGRVSCYVSHCVGGCEAGCLAVWVCMCMGMYP